MRFVLLGVHRGHERHIREQRIFHHLLQEPDRRQLRRGDDVTLSGGDERHIRLQLYLAEERDGAARQQVGDVNVQRQHRNEVGETQAWIHGAEGHERFAMASVTFAA